MRLATKINTGVALSGLLSSIAIVGLIDLRMVPIERGRALAEHQRFSNDLADRLDVIVNELRGELYRESRRFSGLKRLARDQAAIVGRQLIAKHPDYITLAVIPYPDTEMKPVVSFQRVEASVDVDTRQSTERAKRLVERIPVEAQASDNVAWAHIFADERGAAMVIASTIEVGANDYLLLIELSLNRLLTELGSRIQDDPAIVSLFDPSGNLLLSMQSDPHAEPLRESPAREIYFDTERGSRQDIASLQEYRRGEKSTIGVLSIVQAIPIYLLVEKSRGRVLRSVNELHYSAGIAIVALLTLTGIVAFGTSRSIRDPIRTCVSHLERVASGDYERTLLVYSRDEVQRLAELLNRVTQEFRQSRRQITESESVVSQRVEQRTLEIVRAHEFIAHRQKMAAVGELACGLAHELNNPLTAVLGFAKLTLERHNRTDADYPDLTAIVDATVRCKAIVEDLLRFSSQQIDFEFVEMNLNLLIDRVAALSTAALAEQGVEVVVTKDPALKPIRGNSERLQQAVLMIVSNARQAMPDGGRLTISSGSEGVCPYIQISDTGRGIPEAIIDRIFEPFFTTKGDWRAEGLGLSVAYRIVAAHQGNIRVWSREDHGSTFRLVFPETGSLRKPLSPEEQERVEMLERRHLL